MSENVSVRTARPMLGELADRAHYDGVTVYLTRHGRRIAAIVPVQAAELLEDLEDLLDVDAVMAVQARLADGTESRRRQSTAPGETPY